MKNIHYFVALFSFLISFCFWVGQILFQAKQLEYSLDYLYQVSRTHRHFRHMHCWFEKDTNYVIFSIVLLLIGFSIFFSIKGILVLKNIKNKITEELEFDDSNSKFLNKKKSDIAKIIRTLWIYPVISAILWIIFFIFQIVSYYTINRFLSLVYVITISVRQPIYTIVFLLTQKTIKKEFINFVTFKTCKKRKNRSVINPINRINPEKSKLIND